MKKLLKSCIDSDIKSVKDGYIFHTEWLEKMSKRYDQQLCPRCHKWHIFKKRQPYVK